MTQEFVPEEQNTSMDRPVADVESMLEKEIQTPTMAVMTTRQSRQLSKIEEHLLLDISKEKKRPKSKLNRMRQTGNKLLHTKCVLLVIVVLNSLDCLLVLSELVLDVFFIKSMIETAENTMETFNYILREKYPDQFMDVPLYDTHIFYNSVLKADLLWDNSSILEYCPTEYNHTRVKRARPSHVMKRVVLTKTFESEDDPEFLHNDPEFSHNNIDTPEEIVSHAFHKASIIILGILVGITLFKVFCCGTELFKHKLELFDSFVVVASFIADLYFIDGLTNYPLESFVLILALMVPWRVIRVLNSLVISVKDNLTLQMKLMYKKNKIQSEKISKLKADREQHQATLDSLVQLCSSLGTNEHLQNLIKQNKGSSKTKTISFGSCFGLSQKPSFDHGDQTPNFDGYNSS